MLPHRIGMTLTSVFLLAAAGCQRAESPPVTSEGTTDEPADQIAATEEAGDSSSDLDTQDTTTSGEAANASPTESEASSADEQQVVAAKITPPTDEPSEEPAVEEPAVEEPDQLTIGGPAPPLSIATWVTGKPIESFADGQVYVVEFWATWCGPCKTSMPHLSELNEEYGDDVQVIGVTREDVETVESFLEEEQSEGKTWRDVVTYRLAADENSTTNTAYMEAAGQNGIPTAFIVGRDGMIEWIGHPMGMDQSLAAVVAGDYDRSAALAEFQREQRLQQATRDLSTHLQAEEYDEALKLLATLEEELGESTQLLMYKLAILRRAGRHEEAAPVQDRLVEQAWDNSMMLNQIAWGIATGGEPKDLDLALKAAKQASELTNHESAAILDTLARVHYEMGNLEEAIARQKQAVEHGGGNEHFQAVLEQYQSEHSDEAQPEAESEDSNDTAEEPSENE